MKITKNLDDLNLFDAWSGAIKTKERICSVGKGTAFIRALEELGYENIDETALNDMLWFEPEHCLSLVGIDPNESND